MATIEEPKLYRTDSTCKKCGHKDIVATYCEKEWPYSEHAPGTKGGHIHRHCCSCGHKWLELPLDWDDTHTPLSQVADELTADIPDAEWDKVPVDLSRNMDEHLYGDKTMAETTKRPWDDCTFEYTADRMSVFMDIASYAHVVETVNAIHAAGIVKVEELAVFVQAVRILIGYCPASAADAGVVIKLAHLTGAEKTEEGSE